MEKNLKVIHRLIPFINKRRRQSIVELFSHKTDKVQLMFENVYNPNNIVSINIY